MIERGVDKIEIANFLTQKFTDLKSSRTEKEQVWMECIYAYLSRISDNYKKKAIEEGRSYRYLALTFDAVETLHSQISAMLFPNADWLSVSPGREGRDMKDDDSAKDIELHMKWQHRMMCFVPEYKRMLKQLIIIGNCPWSLNWRTDYAVDYPEYLNEINDWLRDQKLIQSEFVRTMQEYQQVVAKARELGAQPPPRPSVTMPQRPPVKISAVYDGPEFVVGDMFDYVQDPHAPNPKTALRAQRIWRTRAHLKKHNKADETGYRVYENLNALTNTRKRSTSGSDSHEEARSAAFGIQSVNQDQQVELIEYWGTFEIPSKDANENKIYKNYVAVVANGKHLIRFEPSHLWSGDLPRQLSTLIEVPNQIYGIGLIEPALGVQDLATVRANQISDSVAFAINPDMKAVDDGVIDFEEKSGSGHIHIVGQIDNLQPVNKNISGLRLSFSDLAALKTEFQQITRSSNSFTSQHYKKSATEIAQSSGVTGSNLNEIARHLEETSLTPIVELQLQITQQYMETKQAVRVTQGDTVDWKDVNPEDVRKKWDLMISGSQHIADKEKRVQQRLLYLQIVTSNPRLERQVDTRYLLKEAYEEGGFTDSDKMLLPLDQVPEEDVSSENGQRTNTEAAGSGGAQRN